ncbi:MAG: carbon monoxide dehydrogenase [Herminiimonas sp.]|nr:carbon monoxide dehydrogenase [Herminiimonas sp.]MDB5853643.1 carbon monoxide dehydrogenase [Herminiimonas sp.]
MDLTGELVLAAPREKVWHALNDPAMLSQCIPGCEEIKRISDTETRARVLVKMGPVRARFVGKILMTDIVAAQSCKLVFEGSGGAAGFARGDSVVRLSDEGAGTRLAYSTSASVGGKLGQIGGRMIDASARQMADRFFSNLQACLAATSAEGASASGGALPASNTDADRVQTPAPAPAIRPAAALAPISSANPNPPRMAGEGVRVLWFVLGAASTGFGVWLATHFGQ